MLPKLSLLSEEGEKSPLLPPFQSLIRDVVLPFDRHEQLDTEVPVGVRKLDQLLGSIVDSFNPIDRKDFMSSLNFLRDSTGAISTLRNHASPTTSTASAGSLGSSHVARTFRNLEGATHFQVPRFTPGYVSSSPATPMGRELLAYMKPKDHLRREISQLVALETPPVSPEKKSQTKSSLSPKTPPSQLSLQTKEHDALAIKKKRRLSGVKHYVDAQPSMHCHICCRSAKNVKVRACFRVQVGICRKVLCERCLSDFPELAVSVDPEGWTCSHCRDACPPSRAQCFVSNGDSPCRMQSDLIWAGFVFPSFFLVSPATGQTYGRSNMRRREQSMKKQEGAKMSLSAGTEFKA